MLLDSQNLFSNAQAITGSAVSENVVVMCEGEVAFGTPKPLLIQVVEDFAGATSLTVEIETAPSADFAEKVVLASATLKASELVAGAQFPINYLPKGNKGYMRLAYSVEGTATSGKITAGLVAGLSQSYNDIA